jgi:ectoine hydroxylase-related dioxygenase (phytanoyl-CoA dioxygenase family)
VLDAGHLQGHLTPVGVHRDFWLTHPPGTLSFWAATAPVTPENSIELFDDLRLTRDIPDTTALRSVRPELAPGDAVLFDADRLHASVRNESSTTRVSIGTRILPGRRLRYGAGVHWRPFLDPRLVGTRFDALASARSRLTVAAWRRARWRRHWNRTHRTAIAARAR